MAAGVEQCAEAWSLAGEHCLIADNRIVVAVAE